MAANIIEGIEMRTNLLLIDEDTCATNFMIRDCNMDKLVNSKLVNEPITPFISKIRSLYTDYDLSSILVIGGVGSYFQVADNVILMDNYKPINITKKAKELVLDKDKLYEFTDFGNVTSRYLRFESFQSPKGIKIKVDKGQKILYGNDIIDLGYCSQIVEKGQLMAISRCLEYIKQNVLINDSRKIQWSMEEIITRIERDLDKDYINMKLDILNKVSYMNYTNSLSNKLVRPRIQEIIMAINRFRALKIYSDDKLIKKRSINCKTKMEDGDESKQNENDHNDTNDNDVTMSTMGP